MRKLTLTLSDKDYELLSELAKQKECAKVDIVRGGLNLTKWYEDRLSEGLRVLAETTDGTREVDIVLS